MKPASPIGLDGEAHLFRQENGCISVLAVTRTGCFAIRDASGQVRVFHWYYRLKGKRPVVIENTRWIALWSCLTPWNPAPGGAITRLHCDDTALVALDVRSLVGLLHLRCQHNQLTHLDLSGLASLRTVDCSGNDLDTLTVERCSAIEKLRCGGNPRLRTTRSALVSFARSEPSPYGRRKLTNTSLFDL